MERVLKPRKFGVHRVKIGFSVKFEDSVTTQFIRNSGFIIHDLLIPRYTEYVLGSVLFNMISPMRSTFG